jgi:hypothetical protein
MVKLEREELEVLHMVFKFFFFIFDFELPLINPGHFNEMDRKYLIHAETRRSLG